MQSLERNSAREYFIEQETLVGLFVDFFLETCNSTMVLKGNQRRCLLKRYIFLFVTEESSV